MTTTPINPGPTAPAPAPVGLFSYDALTAAASRLTHKSLKERGQKSGTSAQGWQADAWDMFNLVGEERFLATTLAGRMAQARIYVGRLDDNEPDNDPIPVTSGLPFEVFQTLGGGSPKARAAIVERAGQNLFMTGDCWNIGIPKSMMDPPGEGEEDGAPVRSLRDGIDPFAGGERDEDGNIDLKDLVWGAYSLTEVSFDNSGMVSIQLDAARKIKATLDEVYMIRVWRAHPEKHWEADSPTRSSLPVLRELVGLTMHVSAQIDSRLAGAGVFIVPESARRAYLTQAGIPDPADGTDPFSDAVMDVMITAINDRASAAALVPIFLTVPDDSVDKFKHMTFSTPLDDAAQSMREETIRRLALGQDAPPELLLGVGGMNHWGAWLVREDVVTTHLEPPLGILVEAWTSQFLQPILVQLGMSEEEAKRYVVWYDVSHMIIRPNRTEDAFRLHDKGLISDAALRAVCNFDESDAPEIADEKLPVEVQTALTLVQGAPTLLASPGLPEIVKQIRDVLQGVDDAPAADPTGAEQADAEQQADDEDTDQVDVVPDTADDEADPEGEPGLAASAVLIKVKAPSAVSQSEATAAATKGEDETETETEESEESEEDEDQ